MRGARPSVLPNDPGRPASPEGFRDACPSTVSSAHGPRRSRPSPCRESSSADCVGATSDRFRIAHPFHPLRGTEYELVTRKLTWGEDRVFYYDLAGALKSFLTNVTDLLPEDAFESLSARRSAFPVDAPPFPTCHGTDRKRQRLS